VYCQLVELCGCIPARIRHALANLPETLDETYERTLREINKANRGFAHRVFQFVAVAIRPLRVEELAELLAFDFEVGPIPKFREDWRLEDPIHAVLSICPSFLAIVVDAGFHFHHKVVQFSHFSVKEFLTSARLAEGNDIVLRRYHISETPAHTLAAGACLGYLLHLDKDVTSDNLRKLPFTEYFAKHWADHARLEDVSRNVKDGLKELFDPSKPHLAVCIWLRDFSFPPWEYESQCGRPSPLCGTPLHYAARWDLHSVVEFLINEYSQNVNSQDFADSATPLHVALCHGHVEVARMLIERGAGVSAQNRHGQTPLHLVSLKSMELFYHTSTYPEFARMLMELGADVSAQDKAGQTPLHLASKVGQLEVARMLIERGADVSAQEKVGQTPLHLASKAGQLEVARMLIERGADVSARNRNGQTPLHLVSFKYLNPSYRTSTYPEFARMFLDRGVDVSARDKDGQTPLHLASKAGLLEVAHVLIERGANVSALDKDGRTPMHLASQAGQPEVIHMLLVHGTDALVQN